ncbi:MAG: tetratricopeptide repeat protein [Alphaproteobacteria bacterium]|nr:tetratricopeptide repeat protein [Alphaproteobacteria bacterium]
MRTVAFDALLRQSFRAIQSRRFDEARASLLEVLNSAPDHKDALNLLGDLEYSSGRLAESAVLFERSVRGDPEQAPVWLRLGEVYEDLGRAAEAEASFGSAVQLKPDLVEAHYNRARLLRLLGRRADAVNSLDQALQLPPPTPKLLAQMLQLLALLQNEVGDPTSALATLDQALTVAPDRAALHHNRGVVLQRLARSAEALTAYDTAIRLGVDGAEVHYNRGNSLQSLGRSDEALASFRLALARDPQHHLSLYDVSRLRWRRGDEAFTSELDAAARAAPTSAVAPGIKGGLLLRAERYDEAAEAFGRACALADTTPGYFDGLGQALCRLGRFEEGLAAHRRAIELLPEHATAHVNYACGLLQAGEIALATDAASSAVRLDRSDQTAWAYLGIAWRAAGDPKDAWLNDYNAFVQAFDLETPPGWPDMTSLNRALQTRLRELHTDAQAPIDQTLRIGSQTQDNLFDRTDAVIVALRESIAKAVSRYIARLGELPPDPDHPLRGRVSANWRFSDSWSAQLRSGGFHTNHVHPHGWISSAYYVALPPAVRPAGEAGGDQAGWIKFGEPGIAVDGRQLAAQRTVEPRPGRLVLFPSYMWHGTIPFIDVEPRLTVAFDVLPINS